MSNRHKLNVRDFDVPRQLRSYHHKPDTKPVRRTVRNSHNPYHDGIEDAKRAGQMSSRDWCLKRPQRATQGYEEVSTDHRTRDSEAKRIKAERKRKVMYRRWGVTFTGDV